jgi:hypothetical protein
LREATRVAPAGAWPRPPDIPARSAALRADAAPARIVP